MTRTITAFFDDYDDAVEAVSRLRQAGITDADISLVSGSEKHRSATRSNADDDTASDAGKGAAIGGAIGGGAGLLAGLGMLAIPGLGPIVAAGWLASTLAGLAAGAATGGLVDALVDAGVPEDHAHAYAEGIRRGGTMVSARVEDPLAQSEATLTIQYAFLWCIETSVPTVVPPLRRSLLHVDGALVIQNIEGSLR
jgi:hypothetical protein